ncbi:TonB-dependent receptor-like protein [Lutibacter sp. Hel_I_33_5]|uniref:TonB-dependent receptor n=1 Tax=Lutibacter sp. Hel_I_33_5 TaxID=1566289 RepID=UPI00119E3324|nr:TonB-dependent receptor [Lutibacter sp. Hel_I_33_5]TVZ56332.1 TonB-dependent receptor-like protein [Lutibacter sp. Hel_I_33_5]
MKLLHVIILSFSFLVCNAQNAKTNLSISFDNLSIEDAILKIESQTNYKFYFVKDWLDKDIKINKKFTDVSIQNILKDIFKGTLLNFYITNTTDIILTKNNAIHDIIPDTEISDALENKQEVNPIFYNDDKKVIEQKDSVKEKLIKLGKEEVNSVQKKYKISGYIRNTENGKPIINISVSVKGRAIGTSTDTNGFYELMLPTGSYTLVIKSINVKTQKKILVYNDGEINFNLVEKFEALDEVYIETKANRNVKEVIAGVTKIDVESIKNIPLVLGERDILKVATTLPGITTTGEGSNGFNVRGGKTDQNLILLDNAAIYNPSHFFGIFSAINPFTTGEVNIYKGNIPSKYGGRLSSVFDISTKDADTKKITGEVSVGPVTSNVTVEVPVVKGKSGLLLGGRSTYSGWVLRSLKDKQLKNSKASFYDVIAKYNHSINEDNDLRITGYYSKDRFSITPDSLYSYSNRLMSLGWKHRFNDRHKGELILTNSQYQFDIEFDGDFNTDFNLGYKNNETEIKLEANFDYDDTKELSYGIASKLYSIHPGEFKPLNNESDVSPITLDKEKGLESSIFVSGNYEVNEKLAFDVGARYSFYAFLGDTTQRIYESAQPKNVTNLIETQDFGNNEVVKTYGGLEGRLSARYFLTEDFSVKTSYNNTLQYIHTLSTNTTVSPTDTWKLSDKNIKPQRAQQASLGFYKNFKENQYELSLEGYYKTFNDILDYKVGAQLLLNESLETEVLQGKGKSYGIEFLIKKNKERWNGWLGYTYSRTFLKLDSQFAEERVNNGNYFPANYDKPHDFSAVINYKLTKRFSFSANFAYQTGRPITYPVGVYEFGGSQFTVFSDRNEFRIPDYYRLDLGFNFEGNHKVKKLYHSFWNLSIYNVLGRNNPYSVFFVTENGQVKAYKSSIFSIPVPTLTFNFRF